MGNYRQEGEGDSNEGGKRNRVGLFSRLDPKIREAVMEFAWRWYILLSEKKASRLLILVLAILSGLVGLVWACLAHGDEILTLLQGD